MEEDLENRWKGFFFPLYMTLCHSNPAENRLFSSLLGRRRAFPSTILCHVMFSCYSSFRYCVKATLGIVWKITRQQFNKMNFFAAITSVPLYDWDKLTLVVL